VRTWPRLLVLGCGLLLLSGCGGDAGTRGHAGGIPVYDQVPTAPSPEAQSAAVRQGIDFLIAGQNADGSWGGPANPDFQPNVTLSYGTTASFDSWRDATTALCLSALIPHVSERPMIDATIERAATQLFQQPAALRATAGLYYGVWSQAYVLEAACATLATPALAAHRAGEAQIAEMLRIQGIEGGFGYIDRQETAQPSGLGSSSFVTATILFALDRAAQQGFTVPENLLVAGRRSIERQRTVDGNFVYAHGHIPRPRNGVNRTPGAIARNPLCNLALYRDDPAVVPLLRKNLDEFFRFHHFLEMALGRPGGDDPLRPGQFTFHESWHSVAAYFFYFGHRYAAEAARRLPPTERQRFLGGQANILCRLQNPDGSWWDFPTIYHYHPYYGTAFALMALQP
jgi:hypothetical protein